jgi:hypothetical protein
MSALCGAFSGSILFDAANVISASKGGCEKEAKEIFALPFFAPLLALSSLRVHQLALKAKIFASLGRFPLH